MQQTVRGMAVPLQARSRYFLSLAETNFFYPTSRILHIYIEYIFLEEILLRKKFEYAKIMECEKI